MKFVLDDHRVSQGLEHFIDVLKEIRDDPEIQSELAATPFKKTRAEPKRQYRLRGFGAYCNDILFAYFIVGNARDDGTYVLNPASVAELKKHNINLVQKNHCVYFDLGEFLI